MRIFYLAILLILLISCTYQAENIPVEHKDIDIIETKDYIALKPKNNQSKTALLYVPGALVDPHAYIQALTPFTKDQKLLVLIPKVRYHFAIFDRKRIIKVQNQFQEVKSWLLAGHSMGGAAACMVLKKHPDDWEALILEGAYSSVDLSSWQQPILSLRGSQDKVATLKDWQRHEKMLPPAVFITSIDSIPQKPLSDQTLYYTIAGGNHAQFGDYGKQFGDGQPTISSSKQQQEAYNCITTYLNILLKNTE